MKRAIFKQIQQITIKLVQTNLSISQNFPIINENEIVWENYKNISYILKNSPYQEIYIKCLENNDYNVQMIDGALIQLMYRFTQNEITSHRLVYMPNLDIENFGDIPEYFEEKYFGNELFSDIIDKVIIKFPIRFDFNLDESRFIELDHPYCHASLGNIKECRIPVESAISPNRFIEFILRSFYFKKYSEFFDTSSFDCEIGFNKKITDKELKLLHFQ